MSRLIDLTEQTFGNLVIIKRGPNDKHKNARWWCECSCGKCCALVSTADLRSGNTKSCGCYQIKRTIETHTGGKHTKETIKKISLAAVGREISEETKLKMSEAHKNKNITDEQRADIHWIRSSWEYKQLRQHVVFERDNETDQLTGESGVPLEMHHVRNCADNIDLILDPDNCITMTEKNHILFHQLFRKENNNAGQLWSFMLALQSGEIYG